MGMVFKSHLAYATQPEFYPKFYQKMDMIWIGAWDLRRRGYYRNSVSKSCLAHGPPTGTFFPHIPPKVWGFELGGLGAGVSGAFGAGFEEHCQQVPSSTNPIPNICPQIWTSF
jgi:hypothetical protein